MQRDPDETSLMLFGIMVRNAQVSDTPDVVAAGAGFEDGLDLYLYVGANPVTGIDPSGLEQWWENDDWDGRSGILVARNWDAILESFRGDTMAYLGVQGAATWGGYWGGTVSILPGGASAFSAISAGFSEYGNDYAWSVILLPVDIALEGMGRFARVASISYDARNAARSGRAGTMAGGMMWMQKAKQSIKKWRISKNRLRHIVLMHGPNGLKGKALAQAAKAGTPPKGRFKKGGNWLKRIIKKAMESENTDRKRISVNPRSDVGGVLVDYDCRKAIGFDRTGAPTEVIRVVVGPNGDIRTAFPLDVAVSPFTR